MLDKFGPSMKLHDQDLLNLLCRKHGGWKQLDKRWNLQVCF